MLAGTGELVGEIAGEFGGGGDRVVELIGGDHAVEHLGGGVGARDEPVDVGGGKPDQTAYQGHREPIADRGHPVDAAVPQALSPQRPHGVGDQGFERADPFGHHGRQHHPAVHGVNRVVGGSQHVTGVAGARQGEGGDAAVGIEHHGRGQVR